ncbi:hypothetical protein VKT23_017248 [Stygiomarasmius scandens]|uniref:Uncharacterized protein n=1 Tax=Marasmiellus scandens TaxID=2682957 RepID=A0ABR1ISD0_9AGAR
MNRVPANPPESEHSEESEQHQDWTDYLNFSGEDPYSFEAARARVISVRNNRANWLGMASLPEISLSTRWRRPPMLHPRIFDTLTWGGKPDRDSRLDNLPRSEWAETQFSRTVNPSNDAPTFTGPMIAKHLHGAVADWRKGREELLHLRSTIVAIKDGLNMLEVWEKELECQAREVEEDISRLQTLEELAVNHLAI